MSEEEGRWYARLESDDVGEAVSRYLDLWSLNGDNLERLRALGIPPDDFDACYRAFVQGIETMGFSGETRELHLLLLGFGCGRQLGLMQALPDSGG